MFQIIKWVGAAYLIFIGLKLLFAKKTAGDAGQAVSAPKRAVRLFSEGLITQLSNPKAIIFFSALLPQFVTPGGNLFVDFIILGLISIAVEFPVLMFYGWAGEQGNKLILRGRFARLVDGLAGGFLIGAGISLAVVRRP